MIAHHPAIERLSAFAAGSLPLSQSLCISAHVEHCRQCRRELKRLELLGAEIFGRNTPQRQPLDLKQKLMAALDQAGPQMNVPGTATVPESPRHDAGTGSRSDLPHCLRTLLPGGLADVPWKRLTPSIQAARLCTDVNGAKVELLKISPGGQVASHNHTGEEITMVLQGSFSDASGVYREGDILFCGKEDRLHKPIASQDCECICLTSVEAPIQFTGFIARLLNPLIRRSHYAS